MPDDRCLFCINVRSFVKNTLNVILYLILIALPQWMILSMLGSGDHILYTLCCFFGSLILLTAIQMSYRLKYGRPWNSLAIGFCYELLTLGLGTFLMNTSVKHLMTIVSMALLICGFALVFCFFLINGYSFPNPYKMAAFAMLGLIQMIIVMAMGTFYNWQYWSTLTLMLFVPSVLIIMVSHVLISFNNLDVLLRGDSLLAGFVLYVNYVLVLVACFICYQRINDDNFGNSSQPGQKAASPYV